MTFMAKVCILCLLCASPVDAITPVTRVVELLQALMKQVEKEGDTEKSLYEDFVCWGKTIIDEKTRSNAAAKSRLAELEAYFADLDSGRIELTSERTDLEKEISGLMDDMESASEMRDKEHDDFLDAQDEMNKAIDALDGAIDTLWEATKDHTGNKTNPSLLAVRSRLEGAAANGGMEKLVMYQAKLKKAAELGGQFLEKTDATFLKRILLGEVPTVDRKKLNRKGNFKASYKARSFKIQKVLQKMKETFEGNLKDARDKEASADFEFKELTRSKKTQLNAAQNALGKMDSENGAQRLSKSQVGKEMENLDKQYAADKRFIAQTEQALREKADDWKKRSSIRADELAAISKAISILQEDRDVFKRSFASQAQFLQVQQTSHKVAIGHKAVAALKKAAVLSGDKRLLTLASDLASPKELDGDMSDFGPVVSAIQKMISVLKQDEEVDLEKKQFCESDRMNNTRDAIVLSRNIDESTEHIEKLATVIQECEKKIAELEAENHEAAVALQKAESLRKTAHDEWMKTDADDEKAAAVVKDATEVLKVYYENQRKEESLLQEDPRAPPPPPPTWEGGYSGKQGEAMGIVAILEMIHEDIRKDRADALADDKASADEFAAFETDSKAHMTQLRVEINSTTADKGAAMESKVGEERVRNADHGTLGEVFKTIKAADPNCEYYMVNYPMRRRNRQIELDGLQKAKAILTGATFDEAPDPDREIVPGDAASAAFLQKRTSATDRHGDKEVVRHPFI